LSLQFLKVVRETGTAIVGNKRVKTKNGDIGNLQNHHFKLFYLN